MTDPRPVLAQARSEGYRDGLAQASQVNQDEAFENGRELGLQQAHHSIFWTWLAGFVFGAFTAATILIAWSI
ncbi:MAG: hypothetical protein KAY22_25425 [Rhizorhabdus sp.]|uniref:hypothetical protein n=1 Tax=Rhizorhabdus sp. TaxID=1968843 RepID=UPI001B3EBA56|nr:hypothetical protein [Rhizorhabdus sp.]MBP8235639.1 hypothetical protein [Rhizorhabdus sp.]